MFQSLPSIEEKNRESNLFVIFPSVSVVFPLVVLFQTHKVASLQEVLLVGARGEGSTRSHIDCSCHRAL